MKTTPFKKVFHVFIVSMVILISTIVTKNVIFKIKHLYSLESAGNGISCFFDMIQ
jgi:hypothetical protein